jgi:hypothetical protein
LGAEPTGFEVAGTGSGCLAGAGCGVGGTTNGASTVVGGGNGTGNGTVVVIGRGRGGGTGLAAGVGKGCGPGIGVAPVASEAVCKAGTTGNSPDWLLISFFTGNIPVLVSYRKGLSEDAVIWAPGSLISRTTGDRAILVPEDSGTVDVRFAAVTSGPVVVLDEFPPWK